MLITAAYEVARALRVPAVLRRWTDQATILCYHNVVPASSLAGRDPGLHMALDRFEQQLSWLRRHFEPVSLEDLVVRLRARQPVRGLVCLTFDDGYVGFVRWALPVLRSLGVPSTVFLVADAADRPTPFWWDQPQLMARATPERRARWLSEAQGSGAAILQLEGIAPGDDPPDDLLPASWEMLRQHAGPDLTFGAHTCSHRALPTLEPVELRTELERCADRVERELGSRPRFLAYPYGAWSPAVRDAAGRAGYTAALTLDAGRIGADASDALALRRINVPGQISPAAFEAWASGLLPPRRRPAT